MNQDQGIDERRVAKIINKTGWINYKESGDGDAKEMKENNADNNIDIGRTKGVRQSQIQRQNQKQKKNNKNKFTSVLMIPRTAGGRLAADLRQVEMELSRTSRRSVRVVERPGKMLKSMLWKPDPWGNEPCTREKCIVCQQRGPLPGEKAARIGASCRARSVLYSNTCVDCVKIGSGKYVYYGESGKSGHERVSEHYGQANSKSETELAKSHMFNHWQDMHAGDQSQFQYRVVKQYRTPLARQCGEAIRIKTAAGMEKRCSTTRMNTQGVSYQSSRCQQRR